ncbi:TadE/TadG family type IV pilus assembly protein [Nocardioides mesophilus]|uniref:Tad domain-containing protein n=1 Tax=Nocardioides mesophilus TaxID=433659 RepID=A0A7G9RC28_9ACTN|nr:Tad domain-containing protein [Nocardioides mesophilus]QNN53153.1 Tad domain-containing protein [Nocardioides mesophilus]
MKRDHVRRGHDRDEAGAVAILVAVCLTMLLIATAMVLDFGLARVDRQTNKAQADSAALAGARSMGADYRNTKPWAGVCTAVSYLKAEYSAYSITDSWQTGAGAPVSAPCTDTALLNTACTPSTASSWAVYRGTVGAAASPRLLIEVRAGYDVGDSTAFPEELYTTLSNDRGTASAGGCDNLAVIVTQKRKPGLGSLATSGDVTTRIRSVGRVVLGQNGKAPVALLILEQLDCSAINTDGNTTRLFVHGAGDRPGLIHSDSLGTTPGNAGGCNSNQIVGGSGTIKAFRAATGGAAGVIGIRALLPGAGGNPAKAYDPPLAVQAEGAPGSLPEGRPLVTRAPVDSRYLSTVTSKAASVWPMFSWDQATAQGLGYQWITPPNCGGSGIQPTYTLDKVYINCPGGAVFATSTFNGTSMIVNGSLTVKSGEILRMPNVTQLYVKGPGTSAQNDKGLDIGGTLAVHDGGQSSCALTDSATSGRAELVVGSGFVNQSVTNSVLRLCHTSVITLGNTTAMPTYQDPAPPPSDNSRNGYLNINGGAQDWSAPNAKPGLPANQTDWDNFEDLAMWTETSLPSNIGGNGNMTLQGIFMLPNANPFKIGGTGTQIVTNSQYVVRKLQASGGGVLDMAPDANDAVLVNYFGDYVLVR